MGILFDEEVAKEQGRSKGPQPRYEGQVKSTKWEPDLRYAKQKTGVVDIHSSGWNRKDYRQSAATTRNSKRNSDGSITRGFRAKMKTHLKRVSKRPLG